MFLVRTAIWLGIIVTVMPTDKEAQSRMAAAAGNTYKQVATFCDRHEAACAQGSAAWVVVKAKAQVAGRMAFNLAMDRLAPETAAPAAAPIELEPVHPAPRASKAAGQASARSAPPPQGTLRDEDLGPRWQGASARGRI